MKLKLLFENKLILPLLFGFLAAAIIFSISIKYGLGLSPDSACYISIAENILNGDGFAIYDFEPAVAWPPLYSLTLAIGGLINIPLIVWARVLNMILFGLIVYISTRWILSRINNRWLAIVAMLAVLLSIPLIYVAKSAWSETLFILLTLVFLIHLEKSFPKHSNRDVFILAILTALACLTRYIGVTLVLFYTFWLLLLNMDIITKIKKGALFFLVSLAPLSLWLWRNFNVSGTIMGERAESSTSIFKNIYGMTDSVSVWFIPIQLSTQIRELIIGVLLVLAIAWYFRKNLSNIIKNGFSQLVLVNWGFIVIYSAYLLIASTIVAFDPIYHRFTSPLYIPLIVSVLFAVSQTRKFNITLKIVGNVLIVLWLFYIGYGAITEIKVSNREGAGSFASDYWQKMNFPNQIAEYKPDGRIYSNFPDALYILSDIRASMAPRKNHYRSRNPVIEDLESLSRELTENGSATLAWFSNANRGFLMTPEELKDSFELEIIEEYSDGTLYRIRQISEVGTDRH